MSSSQTAEGVGDASGSHDWSEARGEHWRAHLEGFEAMLSPVDAPLLDALDIEGATRIADLGCGSGSTTRALRARTSRAVVDGFDVSPTLLEVARRRSAGQHIRFAEVDLGRAPPPLEPYDRLTSRFGLMFFDDPPEAFARLRRWLAPGGRFAFAVWGPVADNAWATSVRDAVGARVTLPVPIPGAPGPFRYGDVDALLALLGDAGFFELQATDWRGPLPMGSATTPRDAARFALRAFAAMAGALAEAGDTVRGEVERDLADGWTTHLRDGRVQLAARVHLVTGSG